MQENDKPPQELSLADLAKALDNQGIVDLTRAFVNDLRGGISHATAEHFPWMNEIEKTKWSGILCLGMGGSAAGGDFISALSSFQGTVPILVQRDYVLPSWWNTEWLVISTSHSGNTEEALVVRFEGKSEKDKNELFLEVKKLLKNEGLTLDNY